jgi:hypothetical protein
MKICPICKSLSHTCSQLFKFNFTIIIHGFLNYPNLLPYPPWLINISILIKAQGLNDMYIFFLMNLIILIYLIIYQIENPIKLNKKLTILVKMTNEF